ncbi:MAG: hypothetical protein HYT49_03105 [Candidatus Wildermuthbacteria bacterium]|nr:hypothetical protein [Candidatus Wildermuthbacteria bacterium]
MTKFLERLRGLSDLQKKMIVWGVTITIGIGLLAWWIPRISERMQIQQGPSIGEQLQFEELQKQLKDLEAQMPSSSNGEQ